MIDRSFLEKVEEMAKVEQFEIRGRQFASKQLHLVKPATVDPLSIDTLQGLVDYLTANKDGIDLAKATVHVESHLKVSVFGDDALKETALQHLKHNAKRFQAIINREMQLKYTPRLLFQLDLSLEKGDEVMAILDKLPPVDHGQPDPA